MKKIIVGAGQVTQPGWISFQFNQLDIRSDVAWRGWFPPGTLDAILTEHTIEHLTETEARATFENFYLYLKRGGYTRIALPDQLNPDLAYQQWCAPGSTGERFLELFRAKGEPNHQTFWNYRTLINALSDVGFRVRLLEWFDERGQLHCNAWNFEDGFIHRSANSLYTKWFLNPLTGARYTSLIVDAVKV